MKAKGIFVYEYTIKIRQLKYQGYGIFKYRIRMTQSTHTKFNQAIYLHPGVHENEGKVK